MCFDIGSEHLRCWGQKHVLNPDKEVYATLCLQVPLHSLHRAHGNRSVCWAWWCKHEIKGPLNRLSSQDAHKHTDVRRSSLWPFFLLLCVPPPSSMAPSLSLFYAVCLHHSSMPSSLSLFYFVCLHHSSMAPRFLSPPHFSGPTCWFLFMFQIFMIHLSCRARGCAPGILPCSRSLER